MAIEYRSPQTPVKKPVETPSEKREIAVKALVIKSQRADEFFGTTKRKAKTKARTNIRLDDDVLDWFRSTGPGWQVRMQDVLRVHMEANK